MTVENSPSAFEWRLGRGWSNEELAHRLVVFRDRPSSVGNPDLAMTSAHGFNHYGSEAPIGREPVGRPVKDGPFERARALLERYEFSDPRIVVGHFDVAAPLCNRVMLLEIKILGLRFLCGVRVGAVRDHEDGGRHVFAFRYDTLLGHVETGSEWFVLTKEPGTGEIRLAIRAAWRPGELPTWWSQLGFRLFSRHYQRAWHRLAYLRP
ncbi:MAG TPA: DUF1990 family protein, partial [Polyangia bacterium]